MSCLGNDRESRRVPEHCIVSHQGNIEVARSCSDPKVRRVCCRGERVSGNATRDSKARVTPDQIVVDHGDACECDPAFELGQS